MVKQAVKGFIHILGYDIVRYSPKKKSTRSSRLTYYETATGNYYLPTDAKADIVANTIIKNGVFEPEVVQLAKKYIKKDTAVLDLGANFGQMSILFSDLVGSGGMVYSFDADDFVFEILKKNIAANNKQKSVIPIFGAVHNTEGEVLFFPEQDFKEYQAYGSYGIDYNSQSGRAVKSITIDGLNIKEPISFMKIDVQGGDLLAMQGAVETINRNRMPILFEYEYHFEEKYKFCFQEYVDFVKSIGYKFSRVITGHNYLIVPA